MNLLVIHQCDCDCDCDAAVTLNIEIVVVAFCSALCLAHGQESQEASYAVAKNWIEALLRQTIGFYRLPFVSYLGSSTPADSTIPARPRPSSSSYVDLVRCLLTQLAPSPNRPKKHCCPRERRGDDDVYPKVRRHSESVVTLRVREKIGPEQGLAHRQPSNTKSRFL